MGQAIREVMTHDPVTCASTVSVYEAAKAMKSQDIGDLLVTEDGALCGIVTDRDLVLRILAEGRDPNTVRVGEICSRTLVKASPDQPLDEAVRLMCEHAVRRLPVVEGERLVGVLSLVDLPAVRAASSA